jgi:hypothetical protein
VAAIGDLNVGPFRTRYEHSGFHIPSRPTRDRQCEGERHNLPLLWPRSRLHLYGLSLRFGIVSGLHLPLVHR